MPTGSGNVTDGEVLYAAKCAVCHGKTGVEGPNDRLVVHSTDEAFPDAANENTWQHRTIGNYWPYATTVFDYVRRAMPFQTPGVLSNDELYAVTAYLLFVNDVIGESDEMNAQTLPRVHMPNKDNFVWDYRPKDK